MTVWTPMRFTLILLAIAAVSACGSPAPMRSPGSSLAPSPGSSPAPSGPPNPAPSPTPALVPLPEGVSGIPGPADLTAELGPVTPSGELQAGIAADYTLGHCGLLSPIDIDGSLWDPIGSQAPLTADQRGELINATPVVVELVDENTMQLQTPAGAVIWLARHDGSREYFLCD